MEKYKKYSTFRKGMFSDEIKGLTTIDKKINLSQATEALTHGLTLLKRSTNPNYNLYRFNACGHEQFAQPTHVRRDNVVCSTCDLYLAANNAYNRGMFLLNRPSYQQNTVLLECGHVRVSSGQTLKSNAEIKCQQCFEESLNSQIQNIGITLIESKGSYKRFTFNGCGHEKTAHFSQIFKDNLVCQVCKEDGYAKEAEKEGLTYLGFCSKDEVDSNMKRQYRLPCGHDRALRMSHVRDSRWECDICDDSHYHKPSFVYLLRIDLPNGSYSKLGYARNVETRIQGYGIPSEQCTIIAKIPFETGRAAMEYENSLHSKYREQNIDKSVTGQYMINGKTECYPLSMIDVFSSEFKRIL